jgi:hypothetical protein
MWNEGSKIKQIERLQFWQEEEWEEEGNSSRQESKFWTAIKKEGGNITVHFLRVTSRCTNDGKKDRNITVYTTISLLEIRDCLIEQHVSTWFTLC